jgi:hypothetical protein
MSFSLGGRGGVVVGVVFVAGLLVGLAVDRAMFGGPAVCDEVDYAAAAVVAERPAPVVAPGASATAAPSQPVAEASADPRIINAAKVLLRDERRWPGTLLWAVSNIGSARTLYEANRNNACPHMSVLEGKTVCVFERPLFADRLGPDVALPPVTPNH